MDAVAGVDTVNAVNTMTPTVARSLLRWLPDLELAEQVIHISIELLDILEVLVAR